MRLLVEACVVAAVCALVGCGGVVTADGPDAAPSIDASVVDSRVLDTNRPEERVPDPKPKPDPPDEGITPPDGTTGKPCTDDTQCDVTGTGTNMCGNAFAIGTIYPAPVCLGRGCDIGDGTTIMGCDGDLGVCLDDGASGICLGACTFANDGAPPKGCVGKDACNVLGWGKDVAGALVGVGYCFGGCGADADCTKGDRCQKESGLCVKAPVAYTKVVGDPCTSADTKAPAKCQCLLSQTTNKGYCASFCRVGDTTACPAGFTCASKLPTKDLTDGSVLFTRDPTDLAGNCLKNCTVDADCTALNATCQTLASGRVCSPL